MGHHRTLRGTVRERTPPIVVAAEVRSTRARRICSARDTARRLALDGPTRRGRCLGPAACYRALRRLPLGERNTHPHRPRLRAVHGCDQVVARGRSVLSPLPDRRSVRRTGRRDPLSAPRPAVVRPVHSPAGDLLVGRASGPAHVRALAGKARAVGGRLRRRLPLHPEVIAAGHVRIADHVGRRGPGVRADGLAGRGRPGQTDACCRSCSSWAPASVVLVAAAILILIDVALLGLSIDYVAVVRNASGPLATVIYSGRDLGLVGIGLVGWLGPGQPALRSFRTKMRPSASA